jgi:hypothetical protein
MNRSTIVQKGSGVAAGLLIAGVLMAVGSHLVRNQHTYDDVPVPPAAQGFVSLDGTVQQPAGRFGEIVNYFQVVDGQGNPVTVDGRRVLVPSDAYNLPAADVAVDVWMTESGRFTLNPAVDRVHYRAAELRVIAGLVAIGIGAVAGAAIVQPVEALTRRHMQNRHRRRFALPSLPS